MPLNTPNPQFSAILNVDIMSVNRASTRMSTSAPKPWVFELLTPRVYSQSVSILPESQTYSPSQGPAPNFQIRSPYYHRVLSPTDSPCSNDFLLSAYRAFLLLWEYQALVSSILATYSDTLIRQNP